jgi:hypothetical protein
LAKKRKVNLAAVLIIAVIAVVILQSGLISYWDPARISVPFYLPAEPGGTSTTSYFSAETWQKWTIKKNDANGPVSYYETAKKYIYITFQTTPTETGRLYYCEVEIPVKYTGGLPSGPGFMGTTTPSWYIDTEILGFVRVYLNDLGHYVGETSLASIHFTSSDKSGTVKNLKFVVGTHDGIKYYTGRFGIPATSKPIDIESYLISLQSGVPIGQIAEYTLICQVSETAVVAKISPFRKETEGYMKLAEATVVHPGSVKFSLPSTWTGTYATTATFQTQTIGATGLETVTMTWVVPSTSIYVKPTTIGTATFTGYSTVYQGTTVTMTFTPEPTPFPDIFKWLKDALWNFFKSLFGWDLSDWQLWLVIIVLAVAVIYLLYRMLRGGGGGQVVVLKA